MKFKFDGFCTPRPTSMDPAFDDPCRTPPETPGKLAVPALRISCRSDPRQRGARAVFDPSGPGCSTCDFADANN